MNRRAAPSFFEWSYPVLSAIRHDLLNFVKQEIGDKKNYSVLDMGCGMKPYQSFFVGNSRYIGVDIDKSTNADVAAPIWALPFTDGEFDVVLCTQVLEHTSKLEEAAVEIKRVLKSGGVAFVSVPMTYSEHGVPYDYWRFTSFGLRELFKDFDIVRVVPSSSYPSTILQLQNVFFALWPWGTYVFIPVFLISNALGVLFDILGKAMQWLDPKIRRYLGRQFLGHFLRQAYYSMPLNYSIILRKGFGELK